jgi:hypothetical protein
MCIAMKIKLFFTLIIFLSIAFVNCSKNNSSENKSSGNGNYIQKDSNVYLDGDKYCLRYIIKYSDTISIDKAEEYINNRLKTDQNKMITTKNNQSIKPSAIKYIVVTADTTKNAYRFTWDGTALKKN